ncbi:MAG: hypothetical protein SFY95_06030 [Planctomycetota bacterium]|nr:hypothetical protein [Planctomycetota bacterium]
MSEQVQQPDWNTLREKAGPYPTEAYLFVRDGLAHTMKMVYGSEEPTGDESRHVSGQQLCLGLKDYAQARYGLLARTVLDKWHIRKTDDFGKIVFAMIDAGLMRRTEDDSLEDFRGVFDFGEAFATLETKRASVASNA